MDDISSKKHFGACPHDCPDTCAMVYEVKDKKLVGVTGNKSHPMTRGTLCVKLKDYEKRHYHPERIKHPMKRVGKKVMLSFLEFHGRKPWKQFQLNGKKLLMSSDPKLSYRIVTSVIKDWYMG